MSNVSLFRFLSSDERLVSCILLKLAASTKDRHNHVLERGFANILCQTPVNSGLVSTVVCVYFEDPSAIVSSICFVHSLAVFH